MKYANLYAKIYKATIFVAFPICFVLMVVVPDRPAFSWGEFVLLMVLLAQFFTAIMPSKSEMPPRKSIDERFEAIKTYGSEIGHVTDPIKPFDTKTDRRRKSEFYC